jgi:hypothetical protein
MEWWRIGILQWWRVRWHNELSRNKKAAPPWMAAENLLASFFYFISVYGEMGSPPHMVGGRSWKAGVRKSREAVEVRNPKIKLRNKFETEKFEKRLRGIAGSSATALPF